MDAIAAAIESGRVMAKFRANSIVFQNEFSQHSLNFNAIRERKFIHFTLRRFGRFQPAKTFERISLGSAEK